MLRVTDEDFRSRLIEWDRAAWCLAAAAVAYRPGTDEQRRPAEELLAVLGFEAGGPVREAISETATPEQLIATAVAPLMQAAAVAGGKADAWDVLPDEVLLAQGRVSSQLGPLFKLMVAPMLTGLSDRLEAEGARMLDVGTGVGALAAGFVEAYPALTVVGIDVMPRALDLARTELASGLVADRVELREQDVANLSDVDSFDLAWVPAAFLPEFALDLGVPAVARALRPGGWLMLAHGRLGEGPVNDALTRFKTAAFGGTLVDDADALLRLEQAGLTQVHRLPTPAGAPAIAVGRRATES